MCVCSRSRVVAAAANDSATNGSSAWWPPAASHFASGAGWSVTKQASNPIPSSARAHSVTAAPVTNSSARSTRSVGSPIVKRMGGGYARPARRRSRRRAGRHDGAGSSWSSTTLPAGSVRNTCSTVPWGCCWLALTYGIPAASSSATASSRSATPKHT